ncbi:MAG: HAMP domain-containing histidine kinase [Deltaproteobacteria bacterium]|nr:HAMP domain-containing histidine kinase [Deltaproteobacteria bacterium]
MARGQRSISTPIVLGSVTVALSIALLVGWIVLIAKSPSFSNALAANVTLLVGGIVSIGTIITVLVLFSIFLVREIMEVRRQYSFIDSVTHELKSPLASIKLCLETLGRAEVTITQREQLRGMMLVDVERLTVFIDDILEVSRLTHGRRSYSLEDTNLLAVAGAVAEAVKLRHRLAQDAIFIDIPGELEIVSDRTVIETVLKNLLENAAKYTKPPVRIEVVARPLDEHTIELSVKDNGIGIPKVHLRRIFERFYRVPSEAVYARQGTGIGLFVVSALVRAIGGSIEARSEGPGKGTTMLLFLPRDARS